MRAISPRRSAVTHHFKEIAVGIEKVDAIVVTPIDRRGALDSGGRQTLARAGKVARLHLERVMAAAERVPDDRFARGLLDRRPRNLEQCKVLAAAIQQDLIAESVDYFKAKHLGIEALGAREVRHLNTKMIQPLEFHRGHRNRLSTRIDD